MSKTFVAILTTIAGIVLLLFYWVGTLTLNYVRTTHGTLGVLGIYITILGVFCGWLRVWKRSVVVDFLWWGAILISIGLLFVFEAL